MPAQAIATVFSALADETRLDIVTRLADGDATLSELAGHYDMSIQAVSKHLAVLEDAGVVSRRREAQRRPVRLEAAVFDLMTTWIERYRQSVEARYQRLDRLLTQLADQTPDNDEGAKT
jgi:DNA-binding transcriptional ArsR family regulator